MNTRPWAFMHTDTCTIVLMHEHTVQCVVKYVAQFMVMHVNDAYFLHTQVIYLLFDMVYARSIFELNFRVHKKLIM